MNITESGCTRPCLVGQWARQDRPVFGSFLDEHSQEFLLAPREQFEQIKAYGQQETH